MYHPIHYYSSGLYIGITSHVVITAWNTMIVRPGAPSQGNKSILVMSNKDVKSYNKEDQKASKKPKWYIPMVTLSADG